MPTNRHNLALNSNTTPPTAPVAVWCRGDDEPLFWLEAALEAVVAIVLVRIVLRLYEIGSVHIINANTPAKHGADTHAVEQRETSHVWLTISFSVRYTVLVTRERFEGASAGT
jgi:hypothetical protein